MKKFLLNLILLTYSILSNAQNSSETNLSGTTPIFRATGFGSVPQISSFTHKVSILGYTGSTSTPNTTIGVLGYSATSESTNYGLYGYANGSLSAGNIGVYGNANVNVGNGYGVRGFATSSAANADFLYGGHFQAISNTNINPSVISYGLFAQSGGTGAITTSYGAIANSSSNVSVVSLGIFGESATIGGTGNEMGGSFSARGASTGPLKIGVQAKSSGTTLTQIRYGVQGISDGPASTTAYGVNGLADNSGNGITYGGYFRGQGNGTGNKYGIYATSAGNGTLYAAHLEGKVEVGVLGASHTSIDATSIDSWNGISGAVLALNNNSAGGIYVRGNTQVVDGSVFIDNSSVAQGLFRNKSGTNSDLLPIAYGNISAAGVVQTASSSENVSATKTATGTYQITITGELFAPGLNAYTVVATLKDSYGFIVPSGNGTNLIINTANTSGANTDKPFTFVIFK